MLLKYTGWLILPAILLMGCNKKCTQKCNSSGGGLMAIGYTLAEMDSTKIYRYQKNTTVSVYTDTLSWSYSNATHDTLMANTYISDEYDYMISGPHLSTNYHITNIASGGGDQYSTEYCNDMDNVCNNPPYMNAYTINNVSFNISSRSNSFAYIIK